MANYKNEIKELEMNEEFLTVHGDSIKSLGEGKIGGYLVLFSSASDPDCAGDFFTKETDFDLERSVKSSVYYAHGLDSTIGKRKIGLTDAELKMDEVGIWAEMQLNIRDAYENAIYKMAKAGKLGWSSGTAPHLVSRKPMKGANFVEKWPLGLDASITPSPCEPRTAAMPIKSLELPNFKELMGTEMAEELKMLGAEKRDLLSRAVRENHGSNSDFLDHDDANVYWHDYNDGKKYATPYKIKEVEGISKVKFSDHFEVTPSLTYVALNLNGSKLDKGGHPTGSVLAAKDAPHFARSATDFKEQLTSSLVEGEMPPMSLKDNFDTCVLSVRVMTNRLNDLKQLRESQNRKTPLSKDALDQLKVLESEIKSLIEITEMAIKATDTASKEKDEKIAMVSKVYSDAESNLKWLNEIL